MSYTHIKCWGPVLNVFAGPIGKINKHAVDACRTDG